MLKMKKNYTFLLRVFPKVLQIFLNVSLVFLAVILSFLVVKELVVFSQFISERKAIDYKLFLESILVFFLYFEFITMIVKYFKEDYHFPVRYFIYVGITAMTRLIIVEHNDPLDTLLYSVVILILIIGYFIMNLTPYNRPDSKWFFRQ